MMADCAHILSVPKRSDYDLQTSLYIRTYSMLDIWKATGKLTAILCPYLSAWPKHYFARKGTQGRSDRHINLETLARHAPR